MLNFIAFIMCITGGLFQLSNNNIGLCLMEFMLALINLPFCIKWLKEFI